MRWRRAARGRERAAPAPRRVRLPRRKHAGPTDGQGAGVAVQTQGQIWRFVLRRVVLGFVCGEAAGGANVSVGVSEPELAAWNVKLSGCRVYRGELKLRYSSSADFNPPMSGLFRRPEALLLFLLHARRRVGELLSVLNTQHAAVAPLSVAACTCCCSWKEATAGGSAVEWLIFHITT